MTALRREPSIVVIGACNIDLIAYAPRRPEWGETLHGTRFRTGFGGKGANQAVMAAKLGARVAMISRVGDDAFGRDTLANFRRAGVDARHVGVKRGVSSGVAPILVGPDGRNGIVIVMGANDRLTAADVRAARPAIERADVLVGQIEIPLARTLQALRLARAAGVRTIFNPAPAKPDLPAEAYRLSDVFCPNESEAHLLTGRLVDAPARAEAAAREFLRRGAGAVVLTLGARGSLVVTPDGAEHVPARRVKAIDTTGAGDAFVGSLAYFLARGRALADAARRAGEIATRSVLKPGTQTSFPSRDEVSRIL